MTDSGEGELKKRLDRSWNRLSTHLVHEEQMKILEDAKKASPLKPLIEVITLYNNLKNHTEEEKQILIKEHLKNCNLEQFILEDIAWFVEWFGK